MNQFLFEAELNAMQTAKASIAKTAVANMDSTVHTLARQTFDHLDASALFLFQLGSYLRTRNPEQAANKAAEAAAANGTIVGGPAGGPQA